jgi:hypothetical protein
MTGSRVPTARPRLPLTEEERLNITETAAGIIETLQERRFAALRKVATQIKDQLAGTWFHDAILIQDDLRHEPYIRVDDDTFDNLTVLQGTDQDILQLIPRTLHTTSAQLVATTVYRLTGQRMLTTNLADIPDWDLATSFNENVIPLLADAIGQELAEAFTKLPHTPRLEHVSPEFIRMLRNNPRFWLAKLGVRPVTHITASFTEHVPLLRAFTSRVIGEIVRHIDSPTFADRMLSVASQLAVPFDLRGSVNYSVASRMVWGHLIRQLVSDGARPSVERVYAAVLNSFPGAEIAIEQHRALLEQHPENMPVAPHQTFDEIYDSSLADWERTLSPEQIVQPVDKAATLQRILDTVFPLGKGVNEP